MANAEPLPLPKYFACPYSDSPAEYDNADHNRIATGLSVLGPYDMVTHCVAHVMADGDLAGGLRNLWDFHLLTREMERRTGGKYWRDQAGEAGRHKLWRALIRTARLAHHLYGSRNHARYSHQDRFTQAPGWIDRLFLRALTARDDWGRPTRPITRLTFYIRSHWLRMPPIKLARHLWTKWRKG